MWIAIQNAVGARQGVGGGPGPTPPPYTPPMDAYPADVAYSVRLVNSAYSGPCMEVYRVSDGATQDIGFDSFGRINATELAAFSGGSVLEVQTWYDQMPGANHAVATASVSGSAVLTRAIIYDGSSIITDGIEPALDFVTPPEYPTLRFTNLGVASGYESFQVTNADTTNSGTPLYATSTGYNFNHHQPISYPTGNVYDGFGSNVRPNMGAIGFPNMYMQHVYNTTAGPTKNVRINNTLVGTASAGANVGSLSHYISAMSRAQVGDDPAGRYIGYIKELFIYKSIQTSGMRDALTSNINNFYQIGNFPDYTSGFLADYSGAAAAYSVRKLSNTAIKCMRVRRNVPPYDELDIGFTPAGDLDEQAIVDFGGSDVLVVSRWYDQSGQSNHAVAPSPFPQPQIYNGTAVITENGKPALSFNGSKLGEVDIVLNQAFSSTSVVRLTATPTFSPLFGSRDSGGIYGSLVAWSGNGSWTMQSNSLVSTGDAYDSNQHLFFNVWNGASSIFAKDGGSAVTLNPGTTDWQNLSIGTRGTDPGSSASNGLYQEFIFWDTDKNAAGQRTAIETNINDYYKIIINDEAATSGFLFDYPNAAAAYSVRQLNNNAEYCMQVQRSDGRTLNVGFVAGELDTQAIIDFAGASAATVYRWFDQTGNQNHAVQATPGNQPQIYNGTAVLTDNGRPTLFASGDAFDITTISGLTEYTISYVARGGVGKMPAGNANAASRTYLPWYQNASTALFRHSTVDRSVALTNPISTNQRLTFMYWDSNTVSHAVDGNTPDVSSAGFTAQPTIDRILDAYGGTTYAWDNNFQEIVIWDTDKNAAGQRPAIETNIMTYYGIP